MTVYPWQMKQWGLIQRSIQRDKLPHALMLIGPSGMGKLDFAEKLTASLFCKSTLEDGSACGHCASCHAYISGNSPDFKVMTPEEKSSVIKIDQVRDLIHWNDMSAHSDGYKIVILHPVESMNIAASNALLKVLEEPNDKRMFLLISHQQSSVPATVISRCQKLRFDSCSKQSLTAWLDDPQSELVSRLSFNVPLKAKQMLETDYLDRRSQFLNVIVALVNTEIAVVEAAQQCMDAGIDFVLENIELILLDIQKYHLTQDQILLVNSDFAAEIIAMSSHASSIRLGELLDFVRQLKLDLLNKANFNQQLLMEDLLTQFYQVLRG